MHVFSYVLTHDKGFSPNPFGGVCTLACCKPVLRRNAMWGDLIVGLAAKAKGHRLVYAMVVGERLTFGQYWADPRFRAKRPVWKAPREQRVGDNCYEPLGEGVFRQHRCMHSRPGGDEDAEQKRRDLRGAYVLVAKRFWYFGGDAIKLPRKLEFLVAGRGHRRIDDAAQVHAVQRFLDGLPEGLRGRPGDWPASAATSGPRPSTTGGCAER